MIEISEILLFWHYKKCKNTGFYLSIVSIYKRYIRTFNLGKYKYWVISIVFSSQDS